MVMIVKKRENKRLRAAMIFLGVILGLVCCEFILQISSFLMQGTISADSFKDKSSIKIICMGDSFTFGAGAMPEFSYPAQLQRILDNTISEKSFEVINLGYPDKNSALLAQELPQVIKDYNPDMVFVMIGVNDYCNFKGLGNIFNTHDFSKVDVLANLKIFKLFQIIRLNLKANFSPATKDNFRQKIFAYFKLIIEAAQQRYMNDLKKAEMLAKEAIEKFPSLGLGYVELARVYQEKIFFSQALDVFKKAAGMVISEEELPVFSGLIELSRNAEAAEEYDISIRALVLACCFSLDNEQVYAEFDHIFAITEDPRKAIIIYTALNEIFPEDEQIILRLGRMYKAMRDFEGAKKYWAVLLKNKNFQQEAEEEIASADFFIERGAAVVFNSAGEYGFSEFLNEISVLKRNNVKVDRNYILKNNRILLKNENKLVEKHLNPILAKKIESIANSCDNAGIKLFFVSYPLLVQTYVLAEVKRGNIAFIDLRPRFLEVLETGQWSDFFVHDGHCSALGYEIIGKAVADVIVKQFN